MPRSRTSRGAPRAHRKLAELQSLFERATALEGKYLTKVLIREMRHGMSEGIMLEAIAKMARSRSARFAARICWRATSAAWCERSGRPVLRSRRGPARAGARDEAAQADARATGHRHCRRILDPRRGFALEHKLDGARVQIHHAENGSVRIFSRRLNEITESIPEVVEIVNRIGARHAIFDGEVIAIDAKGNRWRSRS